jgi:hypothetical protein
MDFGCDFGCIPVTPTAVRLMPQKRFLSSLPPYAVRCVIYIVSPILASVWLVSECDRIGSALD